MTHNSGVTDLPISGFPPGGSVAQGLDAGAAAPVPELLAVDSVADVLSAFAGDGPVPAGAAAAGSPAAGPALDGGQAEAISDDERNRYGLLLDRAAERGLLTPREYEVRLADLAAATSVDQMREIVTVLPGREAPRRSPRVARTRTGPRRPRVARRRPITSAAGPVSGWCWPSWCWPWWWRWSSSPSMPNT